MCDLLKCCYLCFNGKDNLIPVYHQNIEDSINIRIKYVLPELLHFGLEVPVLVCCSCLVSLTSFYLFKKRCLENNYNMKNYISRMQNKNRNKNRTSPPTQPRRQQRTEQITGTGIENEARNNNQQIRNSLPLYEEHAMTTFFKNDTEITENFPLFYSSNDRKCYQQFLNDIKSSPSRNNPNIQETNFNLVPSVSNNNYDNSSSVQSNKSQMSINKLSYSKSRFEASRNQFIQKNSVGDINDITKNLIPFDCSNNNKCKNQMLTSSQKYIATTNADAVYKNININCSETRLEKLLLQSKGKNIPKNSFENKIQSSNEFIPFDYSINDNCDKLLANQAKHNTTSTNAVLRTELNCALPNFDYSTLISNEELNNSNINNDSTKENSYSNNLTNTQSTKEQRDVEARNLTIFEIELNSLEPRSENSNLHNNAVNADVIIKEEFIPFDYCNYNLNNRLSNEVQKSASKAENVSQKEYNCSNSTVENLTDSNSFISNSNNTNVEVVTTTKTNLETTSNTCNSISNELKNTKLIKEQVPTNVVENNLNNMHNVTDDLSSNSNVNLKENISFKNKITEVVFEEQNGSISIPKDNIQNLQNDIIMKQNVVEVNEKENIPFETKTQIVFEKQKNNTSKSSENVQNNHIESDISIGQNINLVNDNNTIQESYNEADVSNPGFLNTRHENNSHKNNIKDEIDVKENFAFYYSNKDRRIYDDLLNFSYIKSENNSNNNNPNLSEKQICFEAENAKSVDSQKHNSYQGNVSCFTKNFVSAYDKKPETNNSKEVFESSTHNSHLQNLEKDSIKNDIDIKENLVPHSIDRIFYNELVNNIENEIAPTERDMSVSSTQDNNLESDNNTSSNSQQVETIDLTQFVKCSQCEIELPQHAMSYHKDTHSKCMYECDLCFNRFSQRDGLGRHKRKYHTKSFKCPAENCKELFNFGKELARHVREIHGSLYKCSVCNKKYISKLHLLNHEKVHTTSEFQCSICDKNFAAETGLTCHMVTHQNVDKNIECSICQKKFVHSYNLKCHLKSVHAVKVIKVRSYNCKHCNKKFTRSGNLWQHEKIHTGIKKFVCSICKKCFLHNTHLKQHMEQVHVSEKKFKCSDCKKAFVSDRCLKKHIETHNKKCSVCHKVCANNNCLIKHMNIHSKDIKKYKCSDCNKTFMKKHSLRLHKDINHNESD